MKLTLQQLVELNACEKQRILFAKHFGTEVEITEELCEKFAGDFSWGWAAGNLLKAPAGGEYDRAIAPARAEYNCAITHAWDEYHRAIAPAGGEYKRAAPALAERKHVEASAYSEFNRVKAVTFTRLYNAQG